MSCGWLIAKTNHPGSSLRGRETEVGECPHLLQGSQTVREIGNRSSPAIDEVSRGRIVPLRWVVEGKKFGRESKR